MSSVGGSPLGFGDCSEPLEDAVDDDEGETPDDAVVNKTEGAALPEPLIENGFTLIVEDDDDVIILGALVCGMTPPSPPRDLEYDSRSEMSPEPRCGEP